MNVCKMPARGRRNEAGFTLIELLVVMFIIAVLLGLLLPAVQQVREAARRTQNRNNLRQIGIALHNYHNVHKMFPPGWSGRDANGNHDVNGSPGFGWAVYLLPYLEQENLFQRLDLSKPITDTANANNVQMHLALFRNPSDSGPEFWELTSEADGSVLMKLPTANYVGNFGFTELEDCEGLSPGQQCKGNGMFYHNSKIAIRDVKDGTSHTFHVGERRTDSDKGWFSTWVGVVPGGKKAFARVLGVVDHPPNAPTGHFDDFSSQFSAKGVFFLFVDGHVRFVSENINEVIYRRLSTPAGKEVVPDEF